MGKVKGAKDKYGIGNAFLKGNVSGTSVAVHDREAKAKQKRFKLQQRIEATRSALLRSRRTSGQQSIASQLRHTADDPIHPFWPYLPREARTTRMLCQLRMRRLRFWLSQRRQSIRLILIAYVVVWSIPLLIGQFLMTVVALLPLVLVPPVGYLVYWLVWKEFHA